jgi:hypothetical protein
LKKVPKCRTRGERTQKKERKKPPLTRGALELRPGIGELFPSDSALSALLY